jgi:hypothetical protein
MVKVRFRVKVGVRVRVNSEWLRLGLTQNG